jgi:hypothetical protein
LFRRCLRAWIRAGPSRIPDGISSGLREKDHRRRGDGPWKDLPVGLFSRVPQSGHAGMGPASLTRIVLPAVPTVPPRVSAGTGTNEGQPGTRPGPGGQRPRLEGPPSHYAGPGQVHAQKPSRHTWASPISQVQGFWRRDKSLAGGPGEESKRMCHKHLTGGHDASRIGAKPSGLVSAWAWAWVSNASWRCPLIQRLIWRISEHRP